MLCEFNGSRSESYGRLLALALVGRVSIISTMIPDFHNSLKETPHRPSKLELIRVQRILKETFFICNCGCRYTIESFANNSDSSQQGISIIKKIVQICNLWKIWNENRMRRTQIDLDRFRGRTKYEQHRIEKFYVNILYFRFALSISLNFEDISRVVERASASTAAKWWWQLLPYFSAKQIRSHYSFECILQNFPLDDFFPSA